MFPYWQSNFDDTYIVISLQYLTHSIWQIQLWCPRSKYFVIYCVLSRWDQWHNLSDQCTMLSVNDGAAGDLLNTHQVPTAVSLRKIDQI